jgi:Na+/melibiose symporter-like transporter
MFRKTASNAYKIFGTPSECTTLFSILWSNATIATIAQKLGCEIFPLDENQPGSSQSNQPKISMISAFAIIGWLLFLIVLMLKLHYYVSYKQHKKLVKRLQEKD